MASTRTAQSTFIHAPSAFTLFWLAVSLPLVVWDSGYVLLRPRTMPGGDLQWPLYLPYALYGEVDHIYGRKAFDANNGFTGAQGMLNVIETAMYAYYAWVYYRHARSVGSKKVVVGRQAAVAVLVAFSAAVMTLSKTVLYCEFCFVFVGSVLNLWGSLFSRSWWLIAPIVENISSLAGEYNCET